VNKNYYTYILGNDRPTLYVGVTSSLARRVHEHRQGYIDGFTKKYQLKKLLYFEVFDSSTEAILREKRLKKWNRKWKLDLVKAVNPTLKDLYDDIV
jgi:putative endonuclease